MQISQTVIEVSVREGTVLCAHGKGVGDESLKAALCHALTPNPWMVFDPFLPPSSCS